eukprot:scaffold636694_cov46-Prasinocladus_malaysianus.AAC.1
MRHIHALIRAHMRLPCSFAHCIVYREDVRPAWQADKRLGHMEQRLRSGHRQASSAQQPTSPRGRSTFLASSGRAAYPWHRLGN